MTTLVKRQPRFIRRAQALTRSRIESRYSPAANLSAPGFTASMTVPSVAGVMITPQTALTFSAFYAGIHVISEDIASLPLAVFQQLPNGGSQLEKGHPVTRLFTRTPDGECTDFNWREAYASHVMLWGNGYAEIDWDSSGQLDALHMIHPSLILPKRDQRSGKLYYELQTADSISGPRGRRIAAPWQILHCANLGFNGLVGYSVVALQREMIGLGKAVEQFGAAFFGNGATPSGVIEFQRSMKPEALKNFRESWNLVHQGSSGAHKVALLEEGATWKSTQIPPEDAQFLATRAFQVIEICRILRLPPHKLADYTNAHLDNIEASNIDYEKTCLRPWTIRTEKAIDWRLLTQEEWEAGFYVKHDFRPLLLRTSKDMADFYQKMFQIGYYTVDEIKVLEGSNPIGEKAGGNKRFVLSNLADITLAGDPAKAQQAPPAKGDPGRPERARRCDDPVQDEKGQFQGCNPSGGSKEAGGGGGGGASAPSHDERPTADIVADVTSGHDDAEFKDHEEVQDLEKDLANEVNDIKESHGVEISDLQKDQKDEVKELARDQKEELKDLPDTQAQELKDLEKEHAGEVKDLARDQAGEARDLVKDQEKEFKDLEKDQAGEVKDLVKEQDKEARELEKEQAGEIKDLQKEQSAEMKEVKDDPESTPETIAEFTAAHEAALASLKEDHENPTADLKAEHAEAQASLKEEHEQAHVDLKSEHDQAQSDQKTEHAEAQAELKSEQDQAITDLKEEHEQNLAEMKDRHEQEKKDQIQDHIDALESVKEDHAKEWSKYIKESKAEYSELIEKLKEEKKETHSLRFSMNGVHADA